VDFDDLLFLLRRLLRERPDVRDRLASQFRYVLVDEYQDTNALQADVVRDLSSAHGNVLVVGRDLHDVREMEQLDAIVPISDADAADFRRLGCTRPMHVVPCSVIARDVPPVDSRTAGFIGSLDFRPNQDAVRWILDELWPRVTAQEPDARLSIAGSAPPEWLRRRGIGPVDSAEELMRGVAVFLAPLFAGGGMRIKVLEAMAMGRAVVATTLGAGGIDCPHLVIADDVASFADAVVRLLRDREEAARMGAAARAYVAERYDGASVARGLLRFYQSLQSAKQ